MALALPPSQWFELSFIDDEAIRRVAFQSLHSTTQEDFSSALDKAISSWCDTMPGHSHGMSMIPIPMSIGSMGPAATLLETISDAVCFELEEGGEGPSSQKWLKLLDYAAAIDRLQGNTPVHVNFVWDNGGGDDNLFGDGFDCAQETDEQVELVEGFLSLLNEWGEGEGNWYDFDPVINPSVDPIAHRMDFDEFEQWHKSSSSPMAAALTPVLQQMRSHQIESNLDISLKNSKSSTRGPRM